MENYIYFFIGTKAQAIKCSPLINYLNNVENIRTTIVDSGQHREIVNSIFNDTNSKMKKISLSKNKKNIAKYSIGIVWFFNFLLHHLIKKTPIDKNSHSLCIVHGDTVSTLLGLFWARRNNLTVLHLESGLTSKKIFNPFPEEIIRRIVGKFSSILICFDDNAMKYLADKYSNTEKLIKQVSENTIVETIENRELEIQNNLITVTHHRTENLLSKKNFQSFVGLLNHLSDTYTLNWYLHEPTKNYLNKYDLFVSEKINIFPLLSHEDFITQVKKSAFVITDGGSIQLECYLINKPTVIWRKTTESEYALNENMFLSKLDVQKSIQFIEENINKKITAKKNNYKPSEEIFNYLKEVEFIIL